MSITREGSPSSFDVEARIAELPLEAMVYDTPTAWAPTPIGLFSDPHVQASQADFYDHELPRRAAPYVSRMSASEAELLHITIVGVRNRRGLGNSLSYSQATEPAEAPDYFDDLRAAALAGRANALGMLVLGHWLDMPSIETGKITFDGESWKYLRAENKAVFDLINPEAEWVADTLDKEPRFGLAAPILNGDYCGEPIRAVTVRARKYRGALTPRARMREVDNFAIHINPSAGFDADIAEEIQRVYRPDLSPAETLGRIASLESFRYSLRSSIADDSEPMPSWVTPLTATSYVFDPTWQERHPDPNELRANPAIWLPHLAEIEQRQLKIEARKAKLAARGW